MRAVCAVFVPEPTPSSRSGAGTPELVEEHADSSSS